MIHVRFLTLFILQRMNDLQAIAFKPSTYDPVADWNDCEETLKEVEIEKEGGYREKYFVQVTPGLNKLRKAEINDSVQNGLHQGKDRPACIHKIFA